MIISKALDITVSGQKIPKSELQKKVMTAKQKVFLSCAISDNQLKQATALYFLFLSLNPWLGQWFTNAVIYLLRRLKVAKRHTCHTLKDEKQLVQSLVHYYTWVDEYSVYKY